MISTFTCTACGGDGWVYGYEHDPNCDGNCERCPVQTQEVCDTCLGSGYIEFDEVDA